MLEIRGKADMLCLLNAVVDEEGDEAPVHDEF
jgi:hypothetical protein